jgi:hypothetical protein
MNADERRKIRKTEIDLLPDAMNRTGDSFALEILVMVLSAFIGVHRRKIAVMDLGMNSNLTYTR